MYEVLVTKSSVSVIGLFREKKTIPNGWVSGNSHGRGVKAYGNPGRKGIEP